MGDGGYRVCRGLLLLFKLLLTVLIVSGCTNTSPSPPPSPAGVGSHMSPPYAKGTVIYPTPANPYSELGVNPAKVVAYGVALSPPPSQVWVHLTEAAARRVLLEDFPSGPGAPQPRPGFLVEYEALRPYLSPPIGRNVLCWAFVFRARIAGLKSLSPSVGGERWTVIFINAIAGDVQGGFIGP